MNIIQNGNGATRDSPHGVASSLVSPTEPPQVDPRSIREAERLMKAGWALGYRPQLPIMSTRSAEVLGWYFFQDAEVMRIHPDIKLPLSYVMGPLHYGEWEIEASSYAAAVFAAKQLRWWWQNAFPDLQEEGYVYGWAAQELEYCEEDGFWVMDRATTFNARDVTPMILMDGQNRGNPVGVRVINLMGGKVDLWAWRDDVPNKAIWYAHDPRSGERYGFSQIRPAWRHWRRLAGIDGIEEITDIAAYRFGCGIVEVLHPNEKVSAEDSGLPGYGVNGVVHTRDIAQFIERNLKSGAGVALPSETWPTTTAGGGARKWEVNIKSFTTNIGQLGEHDDRVARKCSKAIEVPPELFEAAQTGSGYSGRAIPLQGFLVSQQKRFHRATRTAMQQAICPLVRWNFGSKAWVKATPKPLTESVRKSSWEAPGQEDPAAMAQGAPAMSQGVDLPPEPGAGGGGGGGMPPSGPSGMMGGPTGARLRMRVIRGQDGVISAELPSDLDGMDLPELMDLRENVAQVQGMMARRIKPSQSGPGLFDEPIGGGGDSGPGVRHAPEGGTDATGKHYEGGQFLPSQAPEPTESANTKDEPVDSKKQVADIPAVADIYVQKHRIWDNVRKRYGNEYYVTFVDGKWGQMVHAIDKKEAQEKAFAARGSLSRQQDRLEADRQESIRAAEKPKEPEQPESEQETDHAPGDHALHVALADALHAKFKAGEKIDAKTLFEIANKVHGGSRSEGKYGPSDAYDSFEAAFNRHLRDRTDPTADLPDAIRQAADLKATLDQFPTQTNRSGKKVSFQQFSTPPHYAFAANWVANLQSGETVLEPSAGTNSLGVHAQNAGAKVIGNELDPRRAALLEQQLGGGNVHTENAEHISAILPKKGVESVDAVVMNPPFSQTAERMGDKKELMTGANHIEEAMRILKDGGRLVAIVGRGMTTGSGTFRNWFKRMGKEYNVRANIGVSGDEYKKYGTHFGTRLLVIDKDGPQKGAILQDEAEDIPDLMQQLEGVRNDRPGITKPPGAPDGGTPPAPPESPPRPGDVSAPGTGDQLAGGAPGGIPVGGLPGGTTGPGEGTAGEPGSGEVSPESVPAGPGSDVPGRRGRKPRGAGAGGGAGSGAGNAPGVAGAGGAGSRRKSIQLTQVSIPELRPAEPLPIEVKDRSKESQKAAAEQPDSADSIYEEYQPSLLSVPGSFKHITPLVETQAMAGILPPVPTYRPHISPDIVGEKKKIKFTEADGSTHEHPMGISEAGLESVVYAGQAHQKMLPTAEGAIPTRRGYFIGDGTGTGKGRQIGAIMADNINQGRGKHVWITEKWPLLEDAKRDLGDVGVHPDKMTSWRDWAKAGFPSEGDGIMFVTYSTLRGEPKKVKAGPEGAEGEAAEVQVKPGDKPNVDKLIEWLGPDFDGVIAFDEAHAMGNAASVKGARGMTDPSKQAMAGLKLQKALPNARIVYVSATGATELRNLAYADRLGLWGKGTPFADRNDFVSQLSAGGTAAMEAAAQSMKAMGMYGARSLSMSDGTENGTVAFDRVPHTLTDEQKYIHKNVSEAWHKVLQNIDAAIDHTTPKDKHGKPIRKGGAQRTNAMSQFWSAQQRFQNQVLTSFQTPTTIANMEKDLAEGRSPVVSLVNTMEAVTKRQLAKKKDEEEYEELDLSPKEILIDFLRNSFPVHRQQEYADEEGNIHVQLVLDHEGNPVEDPRAVAIRDKAIADVNELRIPESPIDMILNHFGHENVAEVTGRQIRLLDKLDEKGQMRRQKERRNSQEANVSEATAFQNGKKKILVFSEAGGTGRSYHADRNAKNQGRRSFYMLQPGWRADKAVQALGRVHRTNQTSAPLIHLMEIPEIPGQRRFISTIARRLAQLGALTRGERKAGASGLFTEADNLESPIAQEALDNFISELRAGAVPGMQYGTVLEQLGIVEPDEEARQRRGQTKPLDLSVPKFLNRMLSVDLDMQKRLMDELETRIERKHAAAIENGTLDVGVENFNQQHNAEKVAKEKERVVFRDPDSGAEVRHIQTKAFRKVDKTTWDELQKRHKPPQSYVQNSRSGRVWAVYPAGNRTDARGGVTPMVMLRGPTSTQTVAAWQTGPHNGMYETVEPEHAKTQWADEYKNTPEHQETTEHFIAGAMLPVWDRLPTGHQHIYRVKTDKGTFVARHIPEAQIAETLKNLGAGMEEEAGGDKHSPAALYPKLRSGTDKVKLSNGWTVHPALVQGERRIEITGPLGMHAKELEGDGVFTELINYKRRYFIPTGDEGKAVLERLFRHRPVTSVESLGK